METVPNTTQSLTVLPSLTRQSPQSETELRRSKESLQALETARQLAGKILNSYPDYGKSPPSYTAGIVEVIAGYDAETQNHLADARLGVRSVCEYLPTIAAIVKMADGFVSERARKQDIGQRYAGIVLQPWRPSATGFNPFPQLSRAFSDKPGILNVPFETLDRACKVLVLQGKQAAENVLKSSKFKHTQAEA